MNFFHELVIPNDDLPFKMFIFEGKDGNYHVAKHWHSSIEIFAVVEGKIDFYINSTEHCLEESKILLINSNEIHSINAKQKNKVIVLQIPISRLDRYSEDGYIYFRQIYSNEIILDKIKFMYDIYEKKDYGYELKVNSLFFSLMYDLITQYKEKSIKKDVLLSNKYLNRLSNITKYLEENYKMDLSLEYVAKIFGFSPTYLSRMFQKYARINYKSYLQNIRLENAYRELLNTSNSIGNIAINNGFPNSKAFSKTFFKRYDMFPNEYRKLMKNKI